tara:strand:+ start:150 stop:572 length:423 start_codon:yes stop_codon:yes gene_type:complete
MNTYIVRNTQKWGLREYNEFTHPDYEHSILTTEAYKGGEIEITPRNAKEEDKLLNWPVGEDFILENWDWDVVEFYDSDISAVSAMDDDLLESIEEETDHFWGLSDAGWESGDMSRDSLPCETVIEEGRFEVIAPEGWEIV